MELKPYSAVAPRKASVIYYSAEQWEQHRGIITQLYSKENKTLNQVRQILADQHDFHVNERMFKRRVRQWHLDKKHKQHEMLAVLRKVRKRKAQGKASVVRVRGVEVDDAKIRRYFVKKGMSDLDAIDVGSTSEIRTPSDISCCSPASSVGIVHGGLIMPDQAEDILEFASPSVRDSAPVPSAPDSRPRFQMSQTRASALPPPNEWTQPSNAVVVRKGFPRTVSPPTDLVEIEFALKNVQVFSDISLPKGEITEATRIEMSRMAHLCTTGIVDMVYYGHKFSVGDKSRGFCIPSEALDNLNLSLQAKSPIIVAQLLLLIANATYREAVPSFHHIVRFVIHVTSAVLGPCNPATNLLRCGLKSKQARSLALMGGRLLLHTVQSSLGYLDTVTLDILKTMADIAYHGDFFDEAILCLEQLLGAQEALRGRICYDTCWTLRRLADSFIKCRRFDEADTTIEEGVRRAEQLVDARESAEMRMILLVSRARLCREAYGDLLSAKAHLEEAKERAMRLGGAEHSWTTLAQRDLDDVRRIAPELFEQ